MTVEGAAPALEQGVETDQEPKAQAGALQREASEAWAWQPDEADTSHEEKASGTESEAAGGYQPPDDER